MGIVSSRQLGDISRKWEGEAPAGKKRFRYCGRRAWVCAGQDKVRKKTEKWAKVLLDESGIRSCKRCKGGYQLWEVRLGQRREDIAHQI